MKLPVGNAFQPGEALFRRFDRPFRAARQSNQDRALAAPEKPFVARDLIKKADTIARHPAFLPTVLRAWPEAPSSRRDLDQFHR
jgi:hypothetical protein